MIKLKDLLLEQSQRVQNKRAAQAQKDNDKFRNKADKEKVKDYNRDLRRKFDNDREKDRYKSAKSRIKKAKKLFPDLPWEPAVSQLAKYAPDSGFTSLGTAASNAYWPKKNPKIDEAALKEILEYINNYVTSDDWKSVRKGKFPKLMFRYGTKQLPPVEVIPEMYESIAGDFVASKAMQENLFQDDKIELNPKYAAAFAASLKEHIAGIYEATLKQNKNVTDVVITPIKVIIESSTSDVDTSYSGGNPALAKGRAESLKTLVESTLKSNNVKGVDDCFASAEAYEQIERPDNGTEWNDAARKRYKKVRDANNKVVMTNIKGKTVAKRADENGKDTTAEYEAKYAEYRYAKCDIRFLVMFSGDQYTPPVERNEFGYNYSIKAKNQTKDKRRKYKTKIRRCFFRCNFKSKNIKPDYQDCPWKDKLLPRKDRGKQFTDGSLTKIFPR